MKKTGAAALGAGIGAVALGPLGALAGGAIGAWLGKNNDEEEEEVDIDALLEDAAIVLSPEGVKLNESNMTIPWDKVWFVELDEETDTLKVDFVGGLYVFSKDYDFEEGWDNFYPDATPEDADLDEEALRGAIMQPNGVDILKSEWDRRLTSASISIGAFDDASPEKAIYNCTFSTPAAIEFATVYVDLADSLKRQIADPEMVKSLLEYWLAIEQGLGQDDDSDTMAKINELQKLIDELNGSENSGGVSSTPFTAGASLGEYTREEELFLKRARRYANNDGRIDAEERTDLEALAMKLGIDELRTEELIEEAFGE